MVCHHRHNKGMVMAILLHRINTNLTVRLPKDMDIHPRMLLSLLFNDLNKSKDYLLHSLRTPFQSCHLIYRHSQLPSRPKMQRLRSRLKERRARKLKLFQPCRCLAMLLRLDLGLVRASMISPRASTTCRPQHRQLLCLHLQAAKLRRGTRCLRFRGI